MRKTVTLMALIIFLGGCATMSTEPPEGVRADAGFPSPGTKWVYQTVDQSGGTAKLTYTALEEATYEGKPVYRMNDGSNTLIIDKATRNWVATVRDAKERLAASPSDQMFSFPISVGKSWAAKYNYHDRDRGLSFSDVTYSWSVAAYEEVKVPAGAFKAFRLEGNNPFSSTTIWYAPELRLIVKRVDERGPTHYLGTGKATTELLEYPAK